MNQALITVAAIVISSIISILATIAARGRSEGRDEQRFVDFAKDLGRIEQRLDKLNGDVNAIGQIAREGRTVLKIAGQTGEVPRFVPRDSGEGPVVP